jgi:hypothetical protein
MRANFAILGRAQRRKKTKLKAAVAGTGNLSYPVGGVGRPEAIVTLGHGVGAPTARAGARGIHAKGYKYIVIVWDGVDDNVFYIYMR